MVINEKPKSGVIWERKIIKPPDMVNEFKLVDERKGGRVRRHHRAVLQMAMSGPGRKPMGEPPLMLWSTTLEEEFSDARLSALFAGDREKAERAKDLWGEYLALNKYAEVDRHHQASRDVCILVLPKTW